MAAQFALRSIPLLSTAIRKLFEHNLPAARYPHFAIHKCCRCAKDRWISSLTFMLLASLLFLPRIANATWSGSGFVPTPSSAGLSSAGQADNAVRELEVGKPIERELAGGQHHSYQVSLASGQFLHAVVEPHGIAVTVTLFGPNGKPMMELAVTAGSSEPLFLVAKEPGIYSIEIRSPEGAAAGSCRVELEELRVATSRDNNLSLAQSTLAEAMQLYEQGTAASKQTSIAKDEESLALWRTAGDGRGEARALHALGKVYHELGENQKALECFTDALSLFRAVGDRGGEGRILNDLGETYNILGERQKALDYFNQSLALRREVGDRAGEAEALQNMGWVYNGLAERQEALDYYHQALPLERAAGDREGEAGTLSNMGLVYKAIGEKQKALDYTNHALAMERAIGNRYDESITLNNIGALYDDLAERQKAVDCYRQALVLEREVGNRYGEGRTLKNMGVEYALLGETKEALDSYIKPTKLSMRWETALGKPLRLTTLVRHISSWGKHQSIGIPRPSPYRLYVRWGLASAKP